MTPCLSSILFFPSPRSNPLLRLLLLRLQRLLAITPDHDEAEEASDDGAAKQQQDHGDADRPDARREEGLQRVVLVDEGLAYRQQTGVGSRGI